MSKPSNFFYHVLNYTHSKISSITIDKDDYNNKRIKIIIIIYLKKDYYNEKIIYIKKI